MKLQLCPIGIRNMVRCRQNDFDHTTNRHKGDSPLKGKVRPIEIRNLSKRHIIRGMGLTV